MIHVTDLEAAINHWRARAPARGPSLSAPVAALAEPYAQLALAHASQIDESALSSAARQAWLDWYASTPDTPCIAICSTSQGDAWCKGCGRSEAEVQNWPAMSPFEKRAVWLRIQAEGTAWRFNRYAERAQSQRPPTTSTG